MVHAGFVLDTQMEYTKFSTDLHLCQELAIRKEGWLGLQIRMGLAWTLRAG